MVAGDVVNSVAAGIAAFLVLHVVIWRASPSNSPRILLLALLAGVGVVVSLLVDVLAGGFNGFELCAVLWIDIFAIIFYMFVYAGVARSVSVTLLSRLLKCQDRPLDFHTLVEEYTLSSRFEDRIRLMEKNGLVRLGEGAVRLTWQGLALARGAKVLGQVLGDGLKG
jgi:hypothetical protein